MDPLDLFPCGSCAYYLGLNPACPECEEAREGGPEFAAKLQRMVDEKRERIARLRLFSEVRIALVGCGRSKQAGVHPARELYTGSLFRLTLRMAEVTCHESYILSAKHGLLKLDDRVESYDYTLYDLRLPERHRWGVGVARHLRTLLPLSLPIRFLVFAGSGYVQPIRDAFREEDYERWCIEEPMRGLGLFERLSWLKTHIEERTVP